MSDSDKLDATFRSALGLPDEMLVTDAAYGRTASWDSVAHMQLVAAIENAFDIMLDTEDVIGLSSYAAARQILRDHHAVALEP
jgi:acyl carrier protein